MDELLKGVFADTLGLKSGEVDALVEVSEDGKVKDVQKLNEAIIARKKALEQENINRGLKDAHKKYESFVKNSGFQNDEGLKGVDLVKAFYENKKFDDTELQQLKTKNEELLKTINDKSEIDVEMFPKYIELKNSVKKLQEAIPLKMEEARNEEREIFAKKMRTNSVKKIISDEVINSGLYELPSDNIKQQKMLSKLVLDEFNGYDFIVPEKITSIDDIRIVKSDGEFETDEFGNRVSLRKLVDNIASSNLIEKTGTTRTAAAGTQNNNAGALSFKSEMEIASHNGFANVAEKRAALEAFRKQNT